MVIKGNKLQKNKNQKLSKLRVIILSEVDNVNYYLIEIQKILSKI